MRYSAKSAIETRLTRKFQQLSRGQPCAVCGGMAHCEHHIIRRHQSEILRYYWGNGVHVCGDCHRKIHDGQIPEPVVPKHLELLQFCARFNFKDYLRERGITADEFYREKERELDQRLADCNPYVDIYGERVIDFDIPF